MSHEFSGKNQAQKNEVPLSQKDKKPSSSKNILPEKIESKQRATNGMKLLSLKDDTFEEDQPKFPPVSINKLSSADLPDGKGSQTGSQLIKEPGNKRRSSHWKEKIGNNFKSPYMANKRKPSIQNNIQPTSPLRGRKSLSPLKRRSEKETPEQSLGSKINSAIFDLQNLYQNIQKDPNANGEESPSKRFGDMSPSKNPNKARAYVGQKNIKNAYYNILKKEMGRSKNEVKQDPEEFTALIQSVKDNMRTPNDLRICDIEIVEKTPLERLKTYQDKYPFLKARKSIMKIKCYISLICLKIISHPIFDYFILTAIIVNSLLLAFDDPTTDAIQYPPQIDTALLVIYTTEMALKIMGLGFVINKRSYLRDLWNVMDFVIVVTAYFPIIFSSGGVNLTAFRSLRVLRPLRTISNIPALKVLILTLLQALGPLMDTLFILLFLFLIFAIAGLQLFMGLLKKRCFSLDEGIPIVDPILGNADINNQMFCSSDSDCPNLNGNLYICGKTTANPNWDVTNFDNIQNSLLMVFQIVTLEGWSDTMFYVSKTFSPLVAVYFIVLIVVGSFFFLNLTLAVIKAEFTKNSHEEKYAGKGRKLLSYEVKLMQKLADNKAEVLKLMKKRKEGLIQFNKYEFKKDNLIAVQKHSTHTGPRRRRRVQENASRPRKSLANIQSVFKKMGNGVARKSIGRLADLFRSSKNSKNNKKIHPLTHKNTTDSNTQSAKLAASQFETFREKNSLKSKANPSSHTDENEFNDDPENLKNNIVLNEDRNSNPKLNGQSGQSHSDFPKQQSANSTSKLGLTLQENPEGNRAFSLIKVPSIAEANSRLEQSFLNPGTNNSSKNFISTPRSEYPKKIPGIKVSQEPIQPSLAEKVFLPSPNQEDSEKISLINIAGIRNHPVKIKEVESFGDITHRKPSDVSQLPELNDQTFMEDHPTVSLSRQASVATKLLPMKSNFQHNNPLFRKMNHIQRSDSREGPRRKSTKKGRASSVLPSIMDLTNELNDFEKFHEQGIPSGLLDDSDFFDKRQRYEILRKKKQRKLSKSIKTLKNQNQISNIEDVGDIKTTEEIKRERGALRDKDQSYDSEEEIEDKERIIIDVRHLKPIAKPENEYASLSTDDILPSQKENELRRIEEEERKNLQKARMKLKFKITRNDEKRAKERLATFYSKTQGASTLAVQSNLTIARIKQQKADEAAMEEQIRNAMEDREAPVSSSRNTFGKGFTKSMYKKKTGGRLHSQMTTFGNKSHRNPQHHENDYLSLNQLDDYFELQKRINQAFPNETEVEAPEYEAKKSKEFQYQEEFRTIRKTDLSTNQVQMRNWSGDSVLNMTSKQFPINRVKRALNIQDFDIWRPGVLGVFHALRRRTQIFIETSFFNNVVLLCVILNTIILASVGLVTSGSDLDNTFNSLNFTFTIVFTIEMVCKLIALGVTGYVRDKMNIFDCAIVILSLFEQLFLSGGTNKAVSAFRTVRIFRTFRVLRVTKLLRSLAYMKIIMGVISRSINKFFLIFVLLMLFLFIYSLLGMQIFGGNLNVPDNVGPERVRQNFDSFINAFMTSFQIMTQENWQNILFLMMRSSVSVPFSLVYLVSWIFLGNYIFLNLFLAILLDEFTGQEVEEELEEMEEEDGGMTTIGGNTSDGRNTTQFRTGSRNSSSNFRSMSSKFDSATDDDKSSVSRQIRRDPNIIACKKTFYLFSKDNPIRNFCLQTMQHPRFESTVLGLIMVSSIKLAVDTYIHDSDVLLSNISNYIDYFLNACFALEALIKIISLGFAFDKGSYMREVWNILDFIIVIASFLDMTLSSVNLGFIKILRLLRTLRPLRFVSHNPSMRLVVTALLESMTAIFNVLIVIFMIWLMFAILASNLVGGKLGYCGGMPSDQSYYGINQTICTNMGYNWTNPDVNFDNVFTGLLSLFILSTQENWPDIMHSVQDADDATAGPTLDGNRIFANAFFIIFIFAGSFFLINLFVGAIFLEFTRAEKRENRLQKFLTQEQQRWVIMQRLIVLVKADVSNVEPETKWMKKFFRIINHAYFDTFIMIIILLNIILMAITFDGASDEYNLILKYLNWTFSAIFMAELVLKHLGLGFGRYWRSGWNQFDAFVVMASIVDILMDVLQQGFLKFVKIGPQLARIFRVLRVTRLFKLIRQFEGLQKIINTLLFSLPSLMNVGALSFLVYFIYSILGTFLFKDIQRGDIISDEVHFRDAATAFVTLFRCSTGESWYVIMFDTVYPTQCVEGVENCSQIAAIPFWLSFIVICQYIFLNLFILVILQQFEEYHLNPDNPVNKFRETLNFVFIPHWEKYALKYGGAHMHQTELFEFFKTLQVPLGFKNEDMTQKEMAKEVFQMNIPQDPMGMVFYNDVIYAAFKRGFNNEPISDFTQYQYLLKEENKTRNKLDKAKRKIKNLKLKHQPFRQSYKTQLSAGANPIERLLFMGMTIKSWIKYAQIVTARMKAAKANGLEYVHSESDPDDYTTENSEVSENSQDYSDYSEEENDKFIKEEDKEDSLDAAIQNSHEKASGLRSPLASQLQDRSPKFEYQGEEARFDDDSRGTRNQLYPRQTKKMLTKSGSKFSITSSIAKGDISRLDLGRNQSLSNMTPTKTPNMRAQEKAPVILYNFVEDDQPNEVGKSDSERISIVEDEKQLNRKDSKNE